MAQNLKVCDVSEDVKDKLKKFRYRKQKTVAAIILKVDPKNQQVILDEEYEECTIDELQGELPEFQPRFIVLSWITNHSDGRVSYPLCFIYLSPTGINPTMSMMYAGAKNFVQSELGLTKVFDIRSVEEFTEDWLVDKLKFFK